MKVLLKKSQENIRRTKETLSISELFFFKKNQKKYYQFILKGK